MWQQSLGVTCSLTGRTELAFEIKKKKVLFLEEEIKPTHTITFHPGKTVCLTHFCLHVQKCSFLQF